MKNQGLAEISDSDKLSKWFVRFSDQTVGSSMYQFISKQIASDHELLELAATADQAQPVPNLFLAAVNYLLYQKPDSNHSKYYPNHSKKCFSEAGFFQYI